MELAVIRDKCVKHSVVAQKKAAIVFKLRLRGLNTLGEQRVIFASVNRLHGAIWSFETQIRSLWSQESSHPTVLESLRSKVSASGRHSTLLLVSYHLSTWLLQ